MIIKEITERGCIRNFSDKKISNTEIKEILEAGRLAPSWMNVQPWQFIVTDNEEHKSLLSHCANFQKQLKEASHIIIVLGDLTAWNDDKFGSILSQKGLSQEGINHLLNDKGYNPAKHSGGMRKARTLEQCAYAMAYMNLQAQALGIDSCIIGAFANEMTGFKPELLNRLREVFNLPQGVFINGLLALGYRADGIKNNPKIRKPFKDIVSIEEYGNRIG